MSYWCVLSYILIINLQGNVKFNVGSVFLGGCFSLVMFMMYIKEPFLLLERVAYVVAAGFVSHNLNSHLPYIRHHITVNKMCSLRR